MSQVRPLLSPILVGRDDLLELADRRIAEAAAGHGRLLLLAGEAGIGKSRMLATILRKGAAAGFRVAKGDLAPHDRQVPLASVLDLARTMRNLPAFGSLGRQLLDVEGGQGGDTLGSRRVLVHEIADRIVANIDTPTLLAFEDLQWADEMSLEVIGELARLAVDRPLLLLGPYRLDELPAGSLHREWRARLLNQRLAEETRLRRLTYDQTALVTTLILGTGLPAPRDVVTAVHKRTNGIPLHIEELLAALDDEARLSGRAIREAVVPDTIEDAVLARVGRLSEQARAVARAGAVIGRCFIPEVLAGVMDRPLGDLDAPLEELVTNAILYPFEFLDRGFYDFRHQLLRDALYASVPARELRRFHARAAEFGGLMEGASEIHASVHFERAGLRAQAYRAALAGAQAAGAMSSRREAFELYARAVANAPDDLPAAELGDLFAELNEAAAAIDDVATADSAAATARRHYLAAGNEIAAAQMLINQEMARARDARSMAARDGMLDEARRELEALPPTRERQLAWSGLLITAGVDEFFAGQFTAARARFEEARGIAETAGDESTAIDAEYFLRSIEVVTGSPDAGLAGLLDIARSARDAGYESAGVTAYRNAAILAVRVMDLPVAEMGLREGLRYADEIEQSYCRHLMAAASAHVAWAAGRWDDAVRLAEQELVEPGSRRGGLGCRDALGFVALGRGDVDRARILLRDSFAGGRESGEIGLTLPALWGLAEAALVASEPGTAVEHCETALDLASSTEERALLVLFIVTGVRANLAAGRPDAAERWLARMTTLLEGWPDLARPALNHAEGLVRLADGSTVMARSSLERAIAGWDERGRIWEATWARLDLSACRLRANRPGEAIPVLREVLATAERLGSAPLLARARELSDLARSRGAEEVPWHPLTAREFEIARLVTNGLTNAAIADALSLSPRTVGAHVEHILAKLGVTRRAEIAAWVTAIRPASLPATASVGTIAALR